MNQPPTHPPPPGSGWPPPPPPPPARPRWGRFAAWTIGGAIAAFAIGGGIATLTDTDSEPIANPTACKKAMTEAMAAGEEARPADSLPAPCIGLSEETLQRLVGEVITEYLGSPEADKAFEDAWREAWESALPSATP